ncbi:gamma-glutamyl-gamma-aminobutyrate hydrolase family protein [Candidatus Micrarchaeota archaeon]|nr:gamma-glutamyl-gamma-aminobutyrate hydrolase family protein [Candidatus Micrarchaeota archaeon]
MAKLALINNFDDAEGGPSRRTARFRKWFSELDVVHRSELGEAEFRQSLYGRYDGFVLSGSPHDVTDIGKPQESWMKDQIRFILDSPKPVLGTCFGHQLLCHAFGATVDFIKPDTPRKNNMPARLVLEKPVALLPSVNVGGTFAAEESHNQEVMLESLPAVLENVAVPEPAWQKANAALKESEVQLVRHTSRPIWGTQFHPEAFDGADVYVERTGGALLRQFEVLCDAARS